VDSGDGKLVSQMAFTFIVGEHGERAVVVLDLVCAVALCQSRALVKWADNCEQERWQLSKKEIWAFEYGCKFRSGHVGYIAVFKGIGKHSNSSL
jgi:hypothetical protein